jgi:hypothetical protein
MTLLRQIKLKIAVSQLLASVTTDASRSARCGEVNNDISEELNVLLQRCPLLISELGLGRVKFYSRIETGLVGTQCDKITCALFVLTEIEGEFVDDFGHFDVGDGGSGQG